MSRCVCRSGGYLFAVSLPELSADDVALVRSRVREKLAYVHSRGHAQLFTPVRQDTEWSVNLDGHAAELAWCRYRGVEWSPLHVEGERFTKVADLVDGTEVRHTRLDYGALVLHEPGWGRGRDDPSARWNLVTGSAPRFTWRGWIDAKDGQRPEFWRDDVPYPAFFVPQSVLHGWPYHRVDRS